MYTRLTNQIMLVASKQNMSDSLNRLYQLQQKASTGQKYATASENPAIAAQGISLRSTQNQIDVYQSTMASTNTWLDTTDQALQQVTDTLKNAQNLIIQALNDTQGPDEHKITATAVDGLIQQLIDVGNTEDRGRYIFSGLKTDTKPFVLSSGSAGTLVDHIQMNMTVTSPASGSITLNGISVETDVNNPNKIIVNGKSVEINAPTLPDGSPNPDFPVFMVDGKTVIPNPPTSPNPTIDVGGVPVQVNVVGGNPQFTVAGSVIPVTGVQSFLTPPNAVTVSFSSGSFVFSTPPTTSGSVTGDPNSWYVNGTKITVLNPASPPPSFSVDGQGVNTGTRGYQNLTNVTKYDGASYGGADPTFPVYHHDQVIYQGDGNTITRNIAPSQTMSISVNGGQAFNQINGMFDTLIKLRDSLRGDDYISPHESTTITGPVTNQVAQDISNNQVLANTTPRVATAFTNQEPYKAIISAAYGQLQQITTTISEQLSNNGNKMKDLQDAVSRADQATLEIKSQLSQNEEVNMAEAISDVNNQQVVYQAVINMSGRVNNMMTLFDKI
jgi:flagellin-like hook-associated protein FlgL